ncbi:spore germination protein GerPC [Metabacillus sp. RGM 3146]|uniref:spore germination protein GerPC n=1 Tax=Metabacillus sp. RGM 3146 TaxID=3401092 RepID=UPI003B9C8893
MYYGYDWTNYFQQLLAVLNRQERQIQGLEMMLQQLTREVQEIKGRPTTNIERIDYNFDQLKVQTLEGTLNIGLNPTDPEPIENFEVIQKGQHVGVLQREHNEDIYVQARDQLNTYLSEECINVMEELEKRYSRNLDEGHRNMVIEDIRKQLDTRIHHYLKNVDLSDNREVDTKLEPIVQQIKSEIFQSIETFIKYLPTNIKGDSS